MAALDLCMQCPCRKKREPSRQESVFQIRNPAVVSRRFYQHSRQTIIKTRYSYFFYFAIQTCCIVIFKILSLHIPMLINKACRSPTLVLTLLKTYITITITLQLFTCSFTNVLVLLLDFLTSTHEVNNKVRE
jgi:hypothetical protein